RVRRRAGSRFSRASVRIDSSRAEHSDIYVCHDTEGTMGKTHPDHCNGRSACCNTFPVAQSRRYRKLADFALHVESIPIRRSRYIHISGKSVAASPAHSRAAVNLSSTGPRTRRRHGYTKALFIAIREPDTCLPLLL